MASNWKDVRARSGLDKDRVAARQERLLAEVRAHRLAEVRNRRNLTQEQLAERMGVTQPRISAIERSGVVSTEIETIRKYVAALGGSLEIVADFGDERLVLG